MRFGGVRITGVSRRFWYIVVGVLALLFVAFYMASKQKTTVVNPLVYPAFPTKKLSSEKPTWIEPYISDYGLREPESDDAFTKNYSNDVGLPFRFRVYIPSSDAFSGRNLNVNKYGWSFMPAIFLDPTTQYDADTLQNIAQGSGSQPIELGFPSNQTPAAGQAYEVTGLLYWNTAQLGAGNAATTLPVILSASARPLADAELQAPTTHEAELDLTYQENDMQLDIQRIEWSSGKQVRACISLTNVGSAVPLAIWSGLDGFRAEYDEMTGQGSSTAEPDPNSTLANQDLLDEGSTITGYIIFDNAPASSPDSGMTLYVPPLSSYGQGPPTAIQVNPDQFQDVTQTDRSSRGDAASGCYSAS